MIARGRTARLAACALALVSSGCGTAERDSAERPNVLLIVVDTLRRDRLGAYGGRTGTPNLDALAEESWVFEHAQSPRAKTTPAVASLFTGRYPHEHGVRDLTVPLDPSLPTLAERLDDAGYTTAAIVGNFVLTARRSGLDRGFEHWVEDLPDRRGVPPHDAPQRAATSLTDGALAALGLGAPSEDAAGPRQALVESDTPWFLYLHYMDPHGAYDPPPAWRREPVTAELVTLPVAADGFLRPRIADYNVPADARLFDGGFDAALVRERYDGEVRYTDHELGRLLDALRASGELDRTLVIVTSDHGESLGEHRYWFEHGLYAYEATTAIPLLVRPPAAWRAEVGRRQGDQSLVDVAPTVLALLGQPALHEAGGALRGAASESLWLDDSSTSQPVFVFKTERADLDGTVQLRGARKGRWKLIRALAFDSSSGTPTLELVREELYDVVDDPDETTDLSSQPPEGVPVEELRKALDRLLDTEQGLRGEALAIQTNRARLETEAAEDIERLRQLGYE